MRLVVLIGGGRERAEGRGTAIPRYTSIDFFSFSFFPSAAATAGLIPRETLHSEKCVENNGRGDVRWRSMLLIHHRGPSLDSSNDSVGNTNGQTASPSLIYFFRCCSVSPFFYIYIYLLLYTFRCINVRRMCAPLLISIGLFLVYPLYIRAAGKGNQLKFTFNCRDEMLMNRLLICRRCW